MILKDFLPSIHRNDIPMRMYHSQPDLGTALDKSKRFITISTCQTILFITFRRIDDENMSDIVRFLFVMQFFYFRFATMEEKIMVSSVLRNFNLKEINQSSFSNLNLFLDVYTFPTNFKCSNIRWFALELNLKSEKNKFSFSLGKIMNSLLNPFWLALNKH